MQPHIWVAIKCNNLLTYWHVTQYKKVTTDLHTKDTISNLRMRPYSVQLHDILDLNDCVISEKWNQILQNL